MTRLNRTVRTGAPVPRSSTDSSGPDNERDTMSTELAEPLGGQVVVFSLAGKEFALPIARVQEIIRYAKPRSVSSGVSWVRGVINLRGRIVPVCDLAARLGEVGQGDGESKIVIIESSSDIAGVIVDEVSEVLTFDDNQVDPLPASGLNFFRAVAKLDDRLIVILDPERMLAGITGAQIEQAAGAPVLQLDLLEQSFDLLAPRGEELVERFYEILFERAPAAEPLFAQTDMKRQKAMLLGALVLVRNSLRDLDGLVPKLEAMGARHVAYGALPDHYPVVGEALLAALAELAGEAWTDDLEAAWTEAYGLVSSVMLAGAARAGLAAAA
jgi:chemotaxis signal transduction protein/hemoglobin-like flavoprotein